MKILFIILSGVFATLTAVVILLISLSYRADERRKYRLFKWIHENRVRSIFLGVSFVVLTGFFATAKDYVSVDSQPTAPANVRGEPSESNVGNLSTVPIVPPEISSETKPDRPSTNTQVTRATNRGFEVTAAKRSTAANSTRIATNSKRDSYVRRIRALISQNKYQEAVSTCNLALRFSPGDSEIIELRKFLQQRLNVLNDKK
jgi:hypothetical protein